MCIRDRVKALFPHTIDTGIKHGTVTVMCHHVGYEVTTYRIDGEYEDGRHPKQVVFTPSLIEDLKRRDFTINAMAYNDSRGLVDAFEGQQDLQKGVIRAVGEPEKRVSEDVLRIDVYKRQGKAKVCNTSITSSNLVGAFFNSLWAVFLLW